MINPTELKATRQGLGLTVKEAAELAAINVSPRSFQYWEAGKRTIPDDVDVHFSLFAMHYKLLLSKLTDDISRFKAQNLLPVTDDTKEYSEKVKKVKRVTLPFFADFNDFVTETGNEHVINWRLWQSVIGHLYLIGLIHKIDDQAVIPDDFSAWQWLRGDYDIANDFNESDEI